VSDAVEEELPRAVAITWGMVADPQRGPKRGLSHERIVEEAIAIADAEGLGTVTMSKVAAALGFTTMALYRYVTSKDDLLLLMQESVWTPSVFDRTLPDGRTEMESPGWRAELTEWAGAMRAVYRDHPWLTEMPVSVAQLLTPNNLAVVDYALRSMRDLPVPNGEKVQILLALVTFIRANAEMNRDLSVEASQVPASAGAILDQLVSEERYPFLRPLIDSGEYLSEADSGDADDDYYFGLELILDGVQSYAARHADGSAPAGVVPPVEERSPLELDHVRRDPKVREAVGRRKEAEAKLREARKREQELIKKALERGSK
jgi:AcrR family transcriptional regulator